MGEKRGTKALELWCRRITDGYTGVNVQNMTTSWRDGLAFCAMIHHFRPDLIDFDGLNKNDIYGNNELAFRIAEQHLGIPALLDAEDMASCSVPDRLSILTYLSQFYQTFGGSSPARLAVNKATGSTDGKVPEIPEFPVEKEVPYVGMRKDLCAVCRLPVFLAEKLVLAHMSYHRTCFRCARCTSQLTLGNYYETEEGQYCCETCPDEENPSSSTQNCNDSMLSNDTAKNENMANSFYQQSFSNEDSVIKDICSQNVTEMLHHKDIVIPGLIAQTSELRLNFISTQLHSKYENPFSPDDLPTNEKWSSFQGACGNFQSLRKYIPIGHEHEKQCTGKESYDNPVTSSKLQLYYQKSPGAEADGLVVLANIEDTNHDKLNIEERHGKKLIESSLHGSVKDESVLSNDTSEILSQTDKRIHAESNLSLVQTRRIIFENKKDYIKKNEIEYESLESTIQAMECVQSKDSISNPNAIESIVSKESNFVDNIAEINVKESEKNSKITTHEISLSHVRNISESPPRNPSERESVDDQTCKPFINDDNVKNAMIVTPHVDYPEDLNPFKSDDEGEVVHESRKIMNTSQSIRNLTNPFENEEEIEYKDDEKEDIILPKPALRSNINNKKANRQLVRVTKRRLVAPPINLNPFWSDEDDRGSDMECTEQAPEFTPVPKPRTIKHIQEINSNERNSDHSDLHILNSSLRSSQSGVSFGGACRKKKIAPLPPTDVCSNQRTASPSELPNSTEYHDSSSNVTPKTRKTKPAPQPPIQPSSTSNTVSDTKLNLEELHMDQLQGVNNVYNIWEDEKLNKDEINRNRQSFTHMSCKESFQYKSCANKSVEGKWKRKKGPAPPCPTPHRRKIKVMYLKDVKLELDEIELQQQGLEKQGVRLEQLIRSKCESGCRTNGDSPGLDIEELVLELFGLVNEKNELFRRQAELMLLRRQQRLEEEHAEVEYQIRCLMSQNESTKTDFEKQKEEALIQRLVEIVERRNEIVDCLEMDRRREIEEDRSIYKHMGLFAARNQNESSTNNKNTSERRKPKQNKQKEKGKHVKLKEIGKTDIDKDVDEIELKRKRHTKRKWF